MDPYGNPYAFRPPPPGFVPRPGPHDAPGAPFGGPPPGAVAMKVFVGAIAPGIGDDIITDLLKTCGPLVEWKRLRDPSGKPKGFGFAMYENPAATNRAIRLLGGEGGHQPLVLKARDGSNTEKKLIVKADDQQRHQLEMQRNSGANELEEQVEDEAALRRIKDLIKQIQPSSDADRDSPSRSRDGSRHRDDSRDRDGSRHRGRDSSRHRDRDRDSRSSRRHRSPGHRDAMADVGEFDENLQRQDEEAERQRLERRRKADDDEFHQKEKRAVQRNKSRMDQYKADLAKEKQELEDRPAYRESWATRLAEWDDDVEKTKEEHLYYTSRSKWRKERAAQRRREEELDERDRREHKDEEKAEVAAPQATAMAIKPMAPTKIKLGMSLPSKRVNELAGDEDDDEDGTRKRRALIPLDYSDVQQNTEDMDPEERNERIKALIASIPSNEDGLWVWKIHWEVVNDSLLQDKLVPFINKKLAELLGVEDDDLAAFILNAIKDNTAPKDLVQELEMTLDEDAKPFVMRLWRTLIFETERVVQHL
ncbi:hypothetical protein BC940DRAFT_332933 [Gongronella butleri]|nr:hypothetical protein BC940DRAFT_332933 [Gongronella butleri]